MPNGHGGVIARIIGKWSSKTGPHAHSVGFKRMVMKRVAQREIVKALDLDETSRKHVLKLTHQSLRLNDALSNSRHSISRVKAVRMLEQSREEMTRMLRIYSHELDETHLQSRAVSTKSELQDKLTELRASRSTHIYLKDRFVQHLLQMHQTYLRLYLGESNYARYKHHMESASRLIPKHD